MFDRIQKQFESYPVYGLLFSVLFSVFIAGFPGQLSNNPRIVSDIFGVSSIIIFWSISVLVLSLLSLPAFLLTYMKEEQPNYSVEGIILLSWALFTLVSLADLIWVNILVFLGLFPLFTVSGASGSVILYQIITGLRNRK